mgnify:CR=1 FL=1
MSMTNVERSAKIGDKMISRKLVSTSVLMIVFVVVFTGGAHGQDDNSNHPDLKRHDTLEISQMNGPSLHIVGLGKLNLSYSETIDGYTLVRNKVGVYEYAERASGGDLKASGIVAHDPGEREQKELNFLKNTKKHLRYKPPKLNEVLEKQNQFYRLRGD